MHEVTFKVEGKPYNMNVPTVPQLEDLHRIGDSIYREFKREHIYTQEMKYDGMVIHLQKIDS